MQVFVFFCKNWSAGLVPVCIRERKMKTEVFAKIDQHSHSHAVRYSPMLSPKRG